MSRMREKLAAERRKWAPERRGLKVPKVPASRLDEAIYALSLNGVARLADVSGEMMRRCVRDGVVPSYYLARIREGLAEEIEMLRHLRRGLR